MTMVVSQFTVLFEKPFWIGLYERADNEKYEVCKITFGSEPKDFEIYDFILKYWSTLKFSPPVKSCDIEDKRINPKRMQRLITKQIHTSGIGTKAQQAIKLQYEQFKTVKKERSRKQREEEKARQFQLRCIKKKEKHRGH